MHIVSVGFTMGKKIIERYNHGRSAKQYVLGILKKANKMFEANLNIRLVLGHLVLEPDFAPKCSDKSAGQLSKLQFWSKPSKQALWHHLDDCYGSDGGVIGLGYVGTMCAKYGYNTAITWKTNGLYGRTYKTVAHEIGHNFGAQHSFEEGQGSTGGIMDYGNGRTGWKVQFNKKYRSSDICTELTAAIESVAKKNGFCTKKIFMPVDQISQWNPDPSGGSNGAPAGATSSGLLTRCALAAVALARESQRQVVNQFNTTK